MGACNAKVNKPGSLDNHPNTTQESKVTLVRPVIHSERSMISDGVNMDDGTVAHVEDPKTGEVKKASLFGGGGASPKPKPKRKKNDDAWEDTPGSGFKKIDGPPVPAGEKDTAILPTEGSGNTRKSMMERMFGGNCFESLMFTYLLS